MTKPHHTKATVQDVADIAAVSVATVSRTLSHPDKVSEKTRLKVMNAINQTGYTVNEAARSLRRQRTDTIVILLPDIGNSVFSGVVESVEKIFAANHFNVLIADTRKASMSSASSKVYFSRNKVDGILILDGLLPIDNLGFNQHTPPILYAGEWQDGTDIPAVKIDDLTGARLAAEHLKHLGHSQFGHISGNLRDNSGQIRRDGFRSTLKSLGVDCEHLWEYEGDYTLEEGKKAAHAWFALPVNMRPTGIFCGADVIAFGFISTLIKLGVRVPQDVSVIGFDDLDVAEYYTPALTTIHQPRELLGTIAAHTLLSLIRNEAYEQPETILPWLVVRDSTCSPPQ